MSRRELLVCSGTTCQSVDAADLKVALCDAVSKLDVDDKVRIAETGCMGPCEQGPLVRVLPDDVLYVKVRPEDATEIVEQHIANDRVVGRLLWEGEPAQSSLPFFATQERIVLANSGVIDPRSIDEYIARGGYGALKKVLSEMTPEEIIDTIKGSGLRGRGGAGFPTGRKWEGCRAQPMTPKYVICNGDEGDPGAFMDRSILEGDPHSVIEGMVIAAYAIGDVSEGYVYVRAEYPLAIENLSIALGHAEERGYLGANILGSGLDLRIEIKKGAGAFVCGESTALMFSIEGKRGMPRLTPPRSVEHGLWGKPTVLNNVETFSNVPPILRNGPDWFTKIGTEGSTGTKVFALAGRVRNTGLVEVPMGVTLRQLVFDIGGGIPDGRAFKAVQTGGPSGGCLPEELLDLPIDYESLSEHDATMGSGGVIVLDDSACMVNVARFFLDFSASESCGKCAPCRVGVPAMLEILTRITAGEGTPEDIPRLRELAQVIRSTAFCGLGQTAPNPVVSTLRYFEDEYRAHIEDGVCPAGACKALVGGYAIDPEACKACDACAKACPTGAAQGTPGEPPYSIDSALCVKCGACFKACPFGAILRTPRKVRA